MKRIFPLLAVALVLCSCNNIKKETASREPVLVKVMDVPSTENTGVIGYTGTVEPKKSRTLSCKSGGQLTELRVKQGDFVKTGDVIAVIESQYVRSTWEMAHASLSQAEDGYERARKVHDSGSISEVQWVEIQTKLAQAKAAAASADKALEDCTIKAPFDGYVSELNLNEGVEVSAFEPIAQVLDISELEIHFSIPENEYSRVTVGKPLEIDVPAIDAEDIAAKVSSKGFVAASLSHSYDCTAVTLSKVEGLMPGMVCKIRMEGKQRNGAVVPAAVVQTGSEGRYVWTVVDGKVEKRGVKLGGFVGDGVLVTEGLNEGDKVICEGYHKVSTGMSVKTTE